MRNLAKVRVAASRLATALVLTTLVACGDENAAKSVPQGFEVVATSLIDGVTYSVMRDLGTGCEIVASSNGLMPRNERSADGSTVKQRCVLTGVEQTGAPAGPVTTVLPADPSTQGRTTSQADAVRAAVQQATAPTPAPTRGAAIPPPTGANSSRRQEARDGRAAPDEEDDGVESQLKR